MKKIMGKVMEHKVVAGIAAGATVAGIGAVVLVRKLRRK